MATTIHVDVVSAEESIFAGDAEFVALPGEVGELGIYPRHTPLITRIKPGMVRIKMPGKAEEEHLSAECQERVEAAVEQYLATGPRAAETMFDHLYAELPAAYAGQRAEVKGASHG